jgi:hypothetical protein
MGGQDERAQKVGTETLVAAANCPGAAHEVAVGYAQQINAALANSKETRETLQDASATVPAIAQLVRLVYIQVRDDNQRPAAEQIQKALKAKGFVVPGIETVSKGPNESEVRFFRDSDADLARSVESALPISGAKAKYVRGYENSPNLRPRQIELWLAPGPVTFKPEAQSGP